MCAATGALKPLLKKLAAALGEEYMRFKGGAWGGRLSHQGAGSHACVSSEDVGGGEP